MNDNGAKLCADPQHCKLHIRGISGEESKAQPWISGIEIHVGIDSEQIRLVNHVIVIKAFTEILM